MDTHGKQQQAFREIAYESVLREIDNRELRAENAQLRTENMTLRAELSKRNGTAGAVAGSIMPETPQEFTAANMGTSNGTHRPDQPRM